MALVLKNNMIHAQGGVQWMAYCNFSGNIINSKNLPYPHWVLPGTVKKNISTNPSLGRKWPRHLMRKGIIANMLPRGENRPSGWAAVRLMMGELIPQDNRMGKGGVLPESRPESQHTGHRPLQPGLLKPILSASLWLEPLFREVKMLLRSYFPRVHKCEPPPARWYRAHLPAGMQVRVGPPGRQMLFLAWGQP